MIKYIGSTETCLLLWQITDLTSVFVQATESHQNSLRGHGARDLE